MEQKNALLIARILEKDLKEETERYQECHSSYVEDLIKALRDFYNDNGWYMWELNRLVKDYQEYKEWYDKKNSQ